MERLASIVQGVAWAQALSTAALFGVLRLLAGRRVGGRYLMGASILGSFVLWPNLVAVYAHYEDPATFPSFFDIPDASSPGMFLFQSVMGNVLLVVLLNQYAAFAAVLVIPAVLLAGASRMRYRRFGYGLFLIVLPLSWVLALFNQGLW